MHFESGNGKQNALSSIEVSSNYHSWPMKGKSLCFCWGQVQVEEFESNVSAVGHHASLFHTGACHQLSARQVPKRSW